MRRLELFELIRETPGSAAADLRASADHILHPGSTQLIGTGHGIIIPAGHVGMVCSRSGLAMKRGLFVLNAPGIIDCDYEGELGVLIHNLSPAVERIREGERIAQLLILASPYDALMPMSLSTMRGDGGFGSTGSD
jgi:dUTP pyrophosphatase